MNDVNFHDIVGWFQEKIQCRLDYWKQHSFRYETSRLRVGRWSLTHHVVSTENRSWDNLVVDCFHHCTYIWSKRMSTQWEAASSLQMRKMVCKPNVLPGTTSSLCIGKDTSRRNPCDDWSKNRLCHLKTWAQSNTVLNVCCCCCW